MKTWQTLRALPRRLWEGAAPTPTSKGALPPWDLRAILIGLMVPMGMTVLNLSMFGVALPFIRDSFQVEPDMAAWLVTAYTLPFVMFMPLYGRLGDGLGKRRLFTIGVILFFIGTLTCLLADSITWLIVGRAIQGVGTAGVNPLCIAIISELFPDRERGKAMATWSSIGPATAMVGPFLGGFLIDQFGWQTSFLPAILAAVIALFVVRWQVPKLAPEPQPGFLRNFDWTGMLLVSGTIMSLVAYLSSRSLTGVESLQDWRMALLTAAFLGGFIWWERRHDHPLIPLSLFRLPNFARGSFAAMIRMFLMSSEGFLIPLYLTEVYGLNGSTLGLMITVHAGSLLFTVRVGGSLADRWSRKQPVIAGLLLQAGVMAGFGFLPVGTPLWVATIGLALHGMAAGLSLAVLHRIVMDNVPSDQSGAAAGVYSMSRFFGSIIGATLGGVVLTASLSARASALEGYPPVFWFVAGVGLLGVLTILGVKEEMAESKQEETGRGGIRPV